MKTGWNFDNSYTHLPQIFFNAIEAIPVPNPNLIILNHALAASLGLNIEALKDSYGVAALSGNVVPEGSLPIAQAYAGHQFGNFTMLGDGRAVLIGEHITIEGQRVDIQLKGSGRTPYSRGGDGRAALGPMLREYIISEAMFALGIPTTRSLSVVTTGDTVIRDTEQPGAIMTRVAASHIRVGTFQYASKMCSTEELKALADYTLQRHFSDINIDGTQYIRLLEEVVKRQASLISEWQLVGFIHGVMNTDNMTISGETIDYGPCAFMDVYDKSTVFSSIDIYGRYAYGNQPKIAAWNLARFAETLLPLLHTDKEEAANIANDAISNFMDLYKTNFLKGMRKKLGIINEELADESLIEELLKIMHRYRADYTNTFISLTVGKLDNNDMFKSTEFIKWNELWKLRLRRQEQSEAYSHELMRNSNPSIIPRNHRVEEALDSAVYKQDYSVMNKLLALISTPYAHSDEHEEYCKLPSQPDSNYRTFCGT